MTHPLIPPECQWFFVETMEKGSYGFELYDRDYRDWWPLSDIDKIENSKEWRKIVAAVARCAWLEEAKRHEVEGDYTKRNEANANAHAWAEWGRQ